MVSTINGVATFFAQVEVGVVALLSDGPLRLGDLFGPLKTTGAAPTILRSCAFGGRTDAPFIA
jgi:hypothetical protein